MHMPFARMPFAIVGIMLVSAVAAEASLSVPVRGPRSDAMLPVGLKCPDDNRGVMEVISQSATGTTERLSVVFDGSGPIRLLISYAFFGAFDAPDVIDLVAQEVEGASEIASYAESLRDNVCLAPASARERAYMSFEANRSIVSEGQ